MKCLSKIISFTLEVLFALIFISCASKPKFSGVADLCGLVIDENNNPVPDVVIYCTKESQSRKSAITNDSGVFVIQNLCSGTYCLYGEKQNYTRLEKTEYLFYNRAEIICFQITSFKGAVKNTEELIRRNEKQLALEMLESIVCESLSEEQALVNIYKFFLSADQQERRQLLSEIKKSNSAHKEFFSNYCDSLEVFIK